MPSLEDRIAEKIGKYEELSADPEVQAVCTWVQPNTSKTFDESRLDDGFEDSLEEFFKLDDAAAELIKAKRL